jgi:ribosomal protein S18 acetylase RimI-like enzyme
MLDNPSSMSNSEIRKLKIRRAKESDEVPWQLLLSADGPRAVIKQYLSRAQLWLVELDGQVVGEMVLLETRPGVIEILNIAVTDELQSTGIGTRLLRKARAVALDRNAGRLEVGTGNNCFRQLAFYQRFGFRIVGVETDFFLKRWKKVWKQNGVPLLDLVRMEVALDA